MFFKHCTASFYIGNKWTPADEFNRIEIAIKSFLVDTGEQKILIDTGNGTKFTEKQMKIYGIKGKRTILDALKERNIAPEDIDIVINTHLHFDHCGGNTLLDETGNAVPAFPKATYIIQKAELDYVLNDAYKDEASYFPENYEPLINSGQLKLIEGNTEIVEGISSIVTGGHTKYHMALMIESENERALFWADILPIATQVRPKFITAYDLYPMETIDFKQKYLKKAYEGNIISILNHDPKADFVRTKFNGKNFMFEVISDN